MCVHLHPQKQRKVAENNGEEDDVETHQAALELMKKHAQQRIAVMQGQQLDIDEELEQVRKGTQTAGSKTHKKLKKNTF